MKVSKILKIVFISSLNFERLQLLLVISFLTQYSAGILNLRLPSYFLGDSLALAGEQFSTLLCAFSFVSNTEVLDILNQYSSCLSILPSLFQFSHHYTTLFRFIIHSLTFSFLLFNVCISFTTSILQNLISCKGNSQFFFLDLLLLYYLSPVLFFQCSYVFFFIS